MSRGTESIEQTFSYLSKQAATAHNTFKNGTLYNDIKVYRFAAIRSRAVALE